MVIGDGVITPAISGKLVQLLPFLGFLCLRWLWMFILEVA